MEHVVLHKRDGFYVPWPQPARLPDGRLTVGITESSTGQHAAVGLVGDWSVLESADDGRTWSADGRPQRAPQSWPGGTTREKEDRFAAIMPDGSYLCAGSTGWELWPVERLRDVNERLGRYAKVGVTVDGRGQDTRRGPEAVRPALCRRRPDMEPPRVDRARVQVHPVVQPRHAARRRHGARPRLRHRHVGRGRLARQRRAHLRVAFA